MNEIKINYDVKSIMKKLIMMGLVNIDVVGLYSIKDCILTQRFTGKSYSYRAFNMNTGENKYLFRRKHAINKEDYNETFDLVKSLPFYNLKRFASGEEMIDHIFRVVFTRYGYTVRENQVKLSIEIFQNMQVNEICLSDVPVGLGKTHAYIVAAIVNVQFTRGCPFGNKFPTVITTSSIELQKAIINDYLPSISRMLIDEGILASELTCVLRKGKSHYICQKRLKHYTHTLKGTKKNKEELQALEQLSESKSIDLDDAKDISAYDKKRINVKHSNCFDCKLYSSCRYQRFIAKARSPKYDFQICNHNYYLADIIKKKKELGALIPAHKDVVIDEAHKLIEAARQMYGASIIQDEFIKLLVKAMPMKQVKKSDKFRKKLCQSIINKTNKLFETLVNQVNLELVSDDCSKLSIEVNDDIDKRIRGLIVDLRDLINRIPYSEKRLSSELHRVLESFRKINKADDITWIEEPKKKGQVTFVAIPKALESIINEDFWAFPKSYTLTSGTLAIDKDFDYVKRQLGMKDSKQRVINEITKETPFDFRQNCLIYIPNHMPFPKVNDDNYINRISNEIVSLIKASNGHALVLFTSYKPLKLVHMQIKERIDGIPLFELSRGKTEVIDQYKKSRNGVLFATGSMWEGVNIPGDILSHLIIVKLPFPIPDPITSYERTQYSNQDMFLDEVLLPRMLMKLKQGVGRLIRSENDTGVVSILDSRSNIYGRYKDEVIKALPDCRLVTDRHEIKRFLNRKKDSSFFE